MDVKRYKTQVGFKSRYWPHHCSLLLQFHVIYDKIWKHKTTNQLKINFENKLTSRFYIPHETWKYCHASSNFRILLHNPHLNLNFVDKKLTFDWYFYIFSIWAFGNQKLKKEIWQCSQYLDLNPTCAIRTPTSVRVHLIHGKPLYFVLGTC